MSSIEIDFDVFKELTMRRKTESTTYNDVLRELLGLSAPGVGTTPEKPRPYGSVCIMQGIPFPEGTEFRVTYKGKTYYAEIKNSQWIGKDGAIRKSPSDAAAAITNTNVNGWRFWSFKRPTDTEWRKLRVLQPARAP